ncbi:MAG: GNAT family N-acetyltransferase [Candidatus Saccharimonadales bacterium]
MSERLSIPTRAPFVVLRSITEEDDVERFMALRPFGHPAPPNDYDAPDYQRFNQFNQIRNREDRNNPGTIHTAIHHHSVFVGIADLYPREKQPRTAEIGCEVLNKYQRRGYAFIALEALANYGREALGFQVITAEIKKSNTASVKLIKKLNFVVTKEKTNSYIFTQEQ